MLLYNFSQNKPINFAEVIKNLMRKYSPLSLDKPLDGDPLSEIGRIALTSPHLLADMGFHIDHHLSARHQTVWRRNQLVVKVTTDPGVISVYASDEF